MILIIDFGSQTTHLISRRLKDLGIKSEIVEPQSAKERISKNKPLGIILSGGPSSVYKKDSPSVSRELFKLGIPTLGICYGMQLMSKLLGGKIVSGRKEYGPAILKISSRLGRDQITNKLPKSSTVWMSHGDEIISIPKGFEIIGSTESVKYAFVGNFYTNNFGVQFHPEVEHTKNGTQILRNFSRICKIKLSSKKIDIDGLIDQINKDVGEKYVIGAVSGGVDSTVAGTLVAKAIGKRFIPVYVENGLMRAGTKKHVLRIFKRFGIKPTTVKCQEETIKRLKGITDPEEKRKIIGKSYIEIFEQQVKKLKKFNKHIKFLMQGTIYSDVIESQGTKHASKIKSHHNVGALPKNMKLKLLEPVRFFYKDEVRAIGKDLGLPDGFVQKQVFPGPGYAVRIRGEVTPERLSKIKIADKIVLEELEKAGLIDKVYMSFPIMTGAESVAVKGDGRFFGEVIALRIIESNDVMTAAWSRIPYDILQKISSRIVNEVPNISRVVYDITSKPPGTMEWE